MAAHAKVIAEPACAIPRNSDPHDCATLQLSLRYNDRYRAHEVWQEILGEINTIVATIGLKQVAYDLDEQPSVLCKALKEVERHEIKGRWLLYFVEHAQTPKLAQLLVKLGGWDLAPHAELTPAERLARLESALDANPDIGDAIRRKAGIK